MKRLPIQFHAAGAERFSIKITRPAWSQYRDRGEHPFLRWAGIVRFGAFKTRGGEVSSSTILRRSIILPAGIFHGRDCDGLAGRGDASPRPTPFGKMIQRCASFYAPHALRSLET
jgi:hypothetical protein